MHPISTVPLHPIVGRTMYIFYYGQFTLSLHTNLTATDHFGSTIKTIIMNTQCIVTARVAEAVHTHQHSVAKPYLEKLLIAHVHLGKLSLVWLINRCHLLHLVLV